MICRVNLLGATGSVGRTTAKLLRQHPSLFSVQAVVGGRDALALAAIARELHACFAAIAEESAYPLLKEALADTDIEVGAGPAALIEAATYEADRVIAAIAGTAGVLPTYAAIQAGRTIALANKEVLVCAGHAMVKAAKGMNVQILPMDSEHNAIFQAIQGHDLTYIDRMILTASGGPFRTWSKERCHLATPEEALAHPNWHMGPKITIDSANLMNKGLELIEAHHLFDVPAHQLDVVIHPQSIIHGLVSFQDGAVVAGLAVPDMSVPIAHCLAWPQRLELPAHRLDLTSIAQLHFEPPDVTRFPALALAKEALRLGGGFPTVLNAANEVAVAAFLNHQISFGTIPSFVQDMCEYAEKSGWTAAPYSVEEALELDNHARRMALEKVNQLGKMHLQNG